MEGNWKNETGAATWTGDSQLQLASARIERSAEFVKHRPDPRKLETIERTDNAERRGDIGGKWTRKRVRSEGGGPGKWEMGRKQSGLGGSAETVGAEEVREEDVEGKSGIPESGDGRSEGEGEGGVER